MAQSKNFLKFSGLFFFVCFKTVSAQMYLPVQVGDLIGYYDTNGIQVMKPSFREGKLFTEGMAPVDVGSNNPNYKYMYIGLGPTVKIKLPYKDAQPFSRGKARVYNGTGWNYIDTSGMLLIFENFEEASDFIDGFALVKKSGLYGFIGEDGRFVVKPGYSQCSEMRYGVFAAFNPMNKKFTYLNISKDTLIKETFEGATLFCDSLAAAKRKGKWGFINLKGETVIPFKFDEARSFSNGLAAVKTDNVWFFIDNNGLEQYSTRYRSILFDFREGVALVELTNGNKVYLTKGGKTIPFRID
jgi:hypothetical protein